MGPPEVAFGHPRASAGPVLPVASYRRISQTWLAMSCEPRARQELVDTDRRTAFSERMVAALTGGALTMLVSITD